MNTPSTLIEEITNVTRKMRTVFDNMVKEKGLTLARARILRLLKKADAGATQRALALELEIEGPTLVRLLDNLENHGWIERRAVEGDRRAKQIVLTDEGHGQEREVDVIAQRFRAEVMKGIDAEDMETAIRVLGQMSRNLGAE
ncbi:MAG: MarR family transcriptional regulator [Rhizobium sp.]|nr:MarR family transcriptional regulator [Rhizobium sp.]